MKNELIVFINEYKGDINYISIIYLIFQQEKKFYSK